MAISKAYAGEDVVLEVAYTDSGGTGVDADTIPTITITNSEDTEEVSAASLDDTVGGTGEYEYVWDTDVDASGTGTYTVEVTGEFSAETKILRDTITLE